MNYSLRVIFFLNYGLKVVGNQVLISLGVNTVAYKKLKVKIKINYCYKQEYKRDISRKEEIYKHIVFGCGLITSIPDFLS